MAWRSGDAKPTLTQFRKLSSTLRRTPATFLLPAPPALRRPEVKFRHPQGSTRRAPTPEEHYFLREASRLQEASRWIGSQIGTPSGIPRLGQDSDPSEAAATARSAIAPFLPKADENWSSPSRAFDSWRSALEAIGALVFLFPMGEESAQGFSLDDQFAPVVAVNTFWRDQARVFTLFHEFGHLVTGTSSVCLEHDSGKFKKPTDQVERWCEEFAAALLLPPADVTQFLAERLDVTSGDRVTDLRVATAVARQFQVSIRAATIRLIELGFASWDLYSLLKPSSERKPSGGAPGEGRSRDDQKRDRYGDRTIGLFVEALRSDLLGRADVLDYLDMTDSGLSQAERGARHPR